METPLLAAALIVKNEEKFLPDCLASLNALRPLLSEICIYDTGSTDGTIDIAEAAGARVERGYWDNDFSRARNAAAAMVTAKWILSVDADETVRANQSVLSAHLRSSARGLDGGAEVLECNIQSYDQVGYLTACWLTRRIGRKGRSVWRGSVHEILHPASPRAAVSRLPKNALELAHRGYAVSVEELVAKGLRNVEAGRNANSHITPKDGAEALINEARSHLLAKDLDSALSCGWSAHRTAREAVLRQWALEVIIDAELEAGRPRLAQQLIAELAAEGGGRDHCSWLMARALVALGDHSEARKYLATIQQPVTAAGITEGYIKVLKARMYLAAHAGDDDEAFACCASLMAKHGIIEGMGAGLLAFWGRERSIEALVQLICDISSEWLEQIADELSPLGPSGARAAVLMKQELSISPNRQRWTALEETGKPRESFSSRS